jgi:2-methylcitrate dehydratase PrpD
MDRFIQLIEENHLKPGDIENVIAQPNPIAQFRFWTENRLRTPEDYFFNIPYLLACAVYRINPAFWHDPEVRRDRRIKEFIERVPVKVVIDEGDFAKAKREDPRTFKMRLELVARGRTFKEDIPYMKGAPEPEEYRSTDDYLIDKFCNNTSRILSQEKARQAAHVLLDIDTFTSIDRAMQEITPGLVTV